MSISHPLPRSNEPSHQEMKPSWCQQTNHQLSSRPTLGHPEGKKVSKSVQIMRSPLTSMSAWVLCSHLMNSLWRWFVTSSVVGRSAFVVFGLIVTMQLRNKVLFTTARDWMRQVSDATYVYTMESLTWSLHVMNLVMACHKPECVNSWGPLTFWTTLSRLDCVSDLCPCFLACITFQIGWGIAQWCSGMFASLQDSWYNS